MGDVGGEEGGRGGGGVEALSMGDCCAGFWIIIWKGGYPHAPPHLTRL